MQKGSSLKMGSTVFVEVFDWAQWAVIITAIIGFWRHQMREHEKQIRWRTQTDDRLGALERGTKRLQDGFDLKIHHLRERSDEKFSALHNTMSELKVMLSTAQAELQNMSGTISRIDERTKRKGDRDNG